MATKRKLQVFVSSTYSDLIDERQAAVSAILKAGHIPAGMELFTAGDRSQMDTIERWIDESDVYMLILGGRYGSIEKVSGLSYTELEFDYANSLGKPSFAVVIKEDALEEKIKSSGTQFMEKEHPKELSQFRAKVLSRISSFFADEKDIKLCVYESMSDHAANPALKGWVSADDVEDTKVLSDELKKLREENQNLKDSLEKLEASSAKRVKSSANSEIVDVLKAIKLEVPANLSGGTAVTRTLFELAYSNKDTLINGVTNAISASESETFFYFKVMPKLQAHGLADNEKVPGVRFRRSYLNKAGIFLFAEIERERMLSKKKAIDVETNDGSLSSKGVV